MKTIKKALAILLVAVMLLTAVPLQCIDSLSLAIKANAANIGTYSSTAAVIYAKQYALSYNKEWYFYNNGGDCANFISQCLYVAGVPMTANWHSYDGNATAYVMNDSYTWIRAQELMDYLISIGGVRIDNPKASDFSLGDAVFYNWNGGRMDHSAIVTSIDGGTPKVSCHSTPEMSSKLDAHWTLGANPSCAVLIKLGGDLCDNRNGPDYDYYKMHTSSGLYSSPNAGFITTVSYRHTIRVVEKTTVGGKTWGKINYKGNWGYVDLSKATYKGHFSKIDVTHSFGEWYTVTQATCKTDGVERHQCTRCGLTEDKVVAKGGHVPKAPATCTTAEECGVCGVTLTAALNHSYSKEKLVKSPTCVQKEIYEKNCTRCGHTVTREGAFGEHNYVSTSLSVPTCTTSGQIAFRCTYCNDTYTEDGSNPWSSWTTEKKNELLIKGRYETKTQYRYRDRQLYYNYTFSMWPAWTDNWSDTPVSASDTRQVQTRTVEVSPAVSTYTYDGYVSYNCYEMNSNGYWSHFCLLCGQAQGGTWKPTSYTQSYPATEEALNQRCGHSAEYGGGTYPVSYRCEDGRRYYRVTVNTTPAVTKTQYRYIDKQFKTVNGTTNSNYTMSGWTLESKTSYWGDYGSWSAWQDAAVGGSDSRQVETRTVYRYMLAELGHDFGAAKKVEICADDVCNDSSCSHNGKNCPDKLSYWEKVCNRCGYSYKYDYFETKHSWGPWVTKVAATATQAAVEVSTCSRCGKERQRNHSFSATVVNPTCTEQGYTLYKCKDSGCKAEYKSNFTAPLGHDISTAEKDWQIVKYPTCEEQGLYHVVCTRCDYYEDHPLDPIGHDYDRNNDGKINTADAFETVNATCLKDGYRLYVCENSKEHTYTETITAKGEHDWSAWQEVQAVTCGDEGYWWRECQYDNCDGEINKTTGEIIKPAYEEKDHYFIEHEYGAPVEHDVTCYTDGYTTVTCLICGHTITTPGEKSTGHIWGDWVREKAPTCTEEGLDVRYCQREGCGEKDEIVIPPNGHNLTTEEYPSKCGDKMITVETCTVCGLTNIYPPDPDHDMGDWYTAKEATCTTNGTLRRDCQREDCIYFETEVIVAPGHDFDRDNDGDTDYDDAIVNTGSTCTEKGQIIWECEVCQQQNKEERPIRIHNLITTEVERTCLEDGYTLYECTYEDCDYADKRNIVPSHGGHDMGLWYEITPATDTSEGLEKRECSRCEYTEERIIPIRQTFIATFVADGKIVTTVEFKEGDTELKNVPDVPKKDRYDGVWENYLPLKSENITINAIYTLIRPEDISEIEAEKTATPDEDNRDVNIRLSASAEGKTIVSQTTEKTPLDIVLVVDQSGSMEGNKLTELKNASTAISDLVFEEARLNGVDHRIAIVGFAMGSYTQDSKGYPKYMNSEILTTGGAPVQYSDKSSAALEAAYKNALVSVNDNGVKNDTITKAIAAIEAKGATAAHVGLTMAANVFAQNEIDGTNRKRVVIFMTDGEPTTWSDYNEKDVANPAIRQANQIKSIDNIYGCNATIYSVGIDCDTATNKRFLNAVSSACNVESMSSSISTETNDYFFYSNNISDLEEMFTEIVVENMITTTDFKDITLVDTVSEYFTMTSEQELAFRESVTKKYGISNDDITVTRNADGTTTVKVAHIDPLPTERDGKVIYMADVDFTVSANQKALKAGTYETNTDDAGVILGDSEIYEKLFKKQSVTFGASKGAVAFKINGEIYMIMSLDIGSVVYAPDYKVQHGYVFSKWDVPAGYILEDEYVEFDASLDKISHTITWHIKDEVIIDTYYVGEYIYAPDVEKYADGMTFIGWNKNVPVAMPDKDLEFTACFTSHTHIYNVEETVKPTCTEKGLRTYTCECGYSYTEEIDALGGKHLWVAILGEATYQDTSLEEIRCANCNTCMDKVLVYKIVELKKAGFEGYSKVVYDLTLYDYDGQIAQPDSEVIIIMPIPDGIEDAANLTVYRVDGNKRVKLDSVYDKENKYISFKTEHFCNFEFVVSYECKDSHDHRDENDDYICDDCLYVGWCSWCPRYIKYKDTPVIGLFVKFIHIFVHMAYDISRMT